MNIDREQHLQWCKDRAIEYVDRGELGEAIASMLSDLKKHPETKISLAVMRATTIELLFNGELAPEKVTHWINGFN